MLVKARIENSLYATNLITERNHHVLADEPESENGTDLGPTPDELLMMSLASCTAITLRMYANRKNWTVDAINVTVELERVEGKSIFTRSIELEGVIGEDEQKRLLAIANACPVHKTLSNPIEIKTLLT